jgi:putative ATP-dependent endonuclease of OLD family
MRIYQLEIKNFRGIKEGLYNFTTPLVCLVGHGDTTKSTILDAIEYVLSPNWFIPIDDSDFTDCICSENIEITATVGPVPDEFMSESKYGLYLRKWNIAEKKLYDDDSAEFQKEDGNINVLSVKIIIDANLTPEWFVVTDAHPGEIHIPHKDRQKIGVSRIGENIDNELAWTRGSSLLRLSSDKNEMDKILLEAHRKLRELFSPDDFKSLADSLDMAKMSGEIYGLKTDNLRPNIDPRALKGSSSTLSLHDQTIPFRRMGIGTRRLMAIGLQLHCIEKKGGILLIDEIEHALEPHRLKYLLKIFSQSTKEQNYGQIFMTTQSPATLEELGAEPLYCVHYNIAERKSKVIKVHNNIQGTVRRIPEAFLSPKVIVCEGATEIGLLRAYENSLIKKHSTKSSFAYNKVSMANAEGAANAPQRAYDLSIHNYNVCLFMDSDDITKLEEKEQDLKKNKVTIVRWQNGCSIEMQLFADLPKEYIQNVLIIAKQLNNKDENCILDSINSHLNGNKLESFNMIMSYKGDEAHLRNAIAKSSSGNDWFKSISKAEKLGVFLFRGIGEEMKDTEFLKGFEKISKWVLNGQ